MNKFFCKQNNAECSRFKLIKFRFKTHWLWDTLYVYVLDCFFEISYTNYILKKRYIDFSKWYVVLNNRNRWLYTQAGLEAVGWLPRVLWKPNVINPLSSVQYNNGVLWETVHIKYPTMISTTNVMYSFISGVSRSAITYTLIINMSFAQISHNVKVMSIILHSNHWCVYLDPGYFASINCNIMCNN